MSVRRGLDLLLRLAALGAVAWTLASSLLPAWRNVAANGRAALARAGESPRQARVRSLRPEVAAVYDRLRREIPPDGAYLLVDGGSLAQGCPYWVRYELAPRRAYLVGTLGRWPSTSDLRAAWRDDVRFAVIARPEGAPPEVMEKSELPAALERRDVPPGRSGPGGTEP